MVSLFITCSFCYRNGDLNELSKYGSLHEYLLHLHQNGRQPITMFWWGTQRVVSICSPELFKETIKLTDRPSECEMVTYKDVCTYALMCTINILVYNCMDDTID